MGSSWSGFLPQNEIIKLQWAVLEGCQTEKATKALFALLESSRSDFAQGRGEVEDEGSWTPDDFEPPEAEGE